MRFSGGSGASLVDTAGKLEVKNNGCISLADFGAANITVGAASNVKLWADGNGAVLSQTTGGAMALKVLNGWGVYFDNSLKVHLAGSIAGDGAVQITSTGNLTAKGNITVGSSTPGFSPISLSNSIAGIGNRIAVFESPTTGTYFYGTGLVISGSGYGLGFFGGTDAVVPTNNNYDMVINTSHNVIIGSTSDNGSRLQVAGGITCTGISTAGNITASGTISSPSGSNGTGERFGSGTVVGQYSVAIGNGAGNGNEAGVSIGYMAGMSYSCVGIGYYSNPGWRGVAIGAASSTTSIYGFGGVAIGYAALRALPPTLEGSYF